MRAGAMRTLLRVEENVPVPDGEGGAADAWQSRGVVWGHVEPVSGREQMRAQQVLADTNTRVTIRWTTLAEQIAPTWRFVDVTAKMNRGTLYNIVSPQINKDMRDRTLEFLCNSGLNKG